MFNVCWFDCLSVSAGTTVGLRLYLEFWVLYDMYYDFFFFLFTWASCHFRRRKINIYRLQTKITCHHVWHIFLNYDICFDTFHGIFFLVPWQHVGIKIAELVWFGDCSKTDIYLFMRYSADTLKCCLCKIKWKALYISGCTGLSSRVFQNSVPLYIREPPVSYEQAQTNF